MQRLGPFVWQSLFLTFSRQAWQGRPFGCAACRCFLFCCKRVPAWSVWAMVSKKPPWRLAGQRAFPDPSAHRSAAFCGTGHAEGRPGESIAIQWHLRAAAFASSEGTPLRRCLPPLSRPCRHIRLLRAQRQVQPYLFWRKAAGRRQGASFQPANPAPGRMERKLANVFLFHRPFVHALSQKRLRFLALRALRAPERPQCLFLLRLPGQSRGNAAKGIGSMV